MKMEIAVEAPVAGKVGEIRATCGQALQLGQVVALMEVETSA
jgi:biotin carboxyl carrier protein